VLTLGTELILCCFFSNNGGRLHNLATAQNSPEDRGSKVLHEKQDLGLLTAKKSIEDC